MHEDAPIIGEIYPGNYTWGAKENTVQELFDSRTYGGHWEYIGEFDSKPEIIGYIFDNTDYHGRYFTSGNIYQLVEGKCPTDFCAFINDLGVVDVFDKDNPNLFKPVYGIKNNNDMKKELIGYKVKPEFREYFCNLVQASNDKWNYGVDFVEGGEWYKICKDAGVLDLWCEPVYKTKELSPY